MKLSGLFEWLLVPFILVGGGVPLVAETPAGEEPQWIWSSPGASLSAPDEEVRFEKDFTLPEGREVQSARLLMGVDNAARVKINERSAGSFAGWNPLGSAEVDDKLVAGLNRLQVIAVNNGAGPAGLMAWLEIRFVDGSALTVATGGDWRVVTANGESRPADVIGRNGDAPWGVCLPPEAKSAELPDFSAQGADIQALGQMLRTYHPAANIDIAGTYAMAWLPRAMLWVADGSMPGQTPVRLRTAARLSRMLIDEEGYVSCHQHEGLAHSTGWPFPLPTQSGGFGFYFSLEGVPYGEEFQLFSPENLDGWELKNATTASYTPGQPWVIDLDGPNAAITSPGFDVSAFVAPFIRIKWIPSDLPPGTHPVLEWTDSTEPSTWQRMEFPRPSIASSGVYQDFDIPVYRMTGGEGSITRLRISFRNPAPGRVSLMRIFSAVDSRHTINNANYIIGAADYVSWTGDQAWLTANLSKLRKATRWMIDEFSLREKHVLNTPWIGHDGRSGIEFGSSGEKIVHPGVGVGGNYWDLIPFGGDDVLGTIYAYHALVRMAELEAFATSLGLPPPEKGLDEAALQRLASSVRKEFKESFWNPETGRFAPVDDTGAFRDYGFTFLNNEAIFYGLASESQARKIFDWMTGQRVVEGDTSQGNDIYRWRFAPRTTTKRNIEYYAYVWSAPERIPFGDQVQDGGAVLGFSYHDLMARLSVLGPDNAWSRLLEILDWWEDVQVEGGPRAYYSKPGRGTLQGGGTAGGIGIDKEFYESTMVTSVILDGFLGFVPDPEGFRIEPQLPSDVSTMQVTRVAYRDMIFDLEASPDRIHFEVESGSTKEPLSIGLPPGEWSVLVVRPDTAGETFEASEEFVLNPGFLKFFTFTRLHSSSSKSTL